MSPKKNETIDPTNKEYLEKQNHQAAIDLFNDIELIDEYTKINHDWRTRIALLKLKEILNAWIPY